MFGSSFHSLADLVTVICGFALIKSVFNYFSTKSTLTTAKKQDFTKSMREDLFESIVGAIYLDSSLEKARRFILRFIDTTNMNKKKDIDYKSLLQERIQSTHGANLVYFTYEDPLEKGRFCSEVYINDIFVARAFSRSKKNAQLECAKLALSDDKTLDKILN